MANLQTGEKKVGLDSTMSRRSFLIGTGFAIAGIALSACGPSGAENGSAPEVNPVETLNPQQVAEVAKSCHLVVGGDTLYGVVGYNQPFTIITTLRAPDSQDFYAINSVMSYDKAKEGIPLNVGFNVFTTDQQKYIQEQWICVGRKIQMQ